MSDTKLAGIEFFDGFGVSQTLINRALTAALSMGADNADLYFEYRASQQLALLDGAVDRAYAGVSVGVGIRAIKDGRTGYAYTEDLNLSAVSEAAQNGRKRSGHEQCNETTPTPSLSAPELLSSKTSLGRCGDYGRVTPT